MQRHFRQAALAAAVLSTFNIYAADETEVVVTATRFSEKSLDAPIGLQIIRAEDIRQSTATNLGEVLSRLGGVLTRVSFLGLPDTPIDLRGFGATGDQNTLILVNGVRISENELASARIGSIPLNAVERIEILRGAGAVLYGGGATAGVINIITRSALARPPGARLFASTGSYGSSELRGNLATGKGPWGLVLDASSSASDNYRDNNRATSDNLNGELRWDDVNGWLALRVNADRQRARTPGIRTEAQLGSDPRGTSNPNDYANMDGVQGIVSGEYRWQDGLTFSADASWRDKVSRFFSQSGFGTTLTGIHVDSLTFSPRLKWRTDFGGMENVMIAGVDWADWDYRTGWQATGFFLNRNETGTQRNQAFYLQDQLRFAPDWRLSLGLRSEKVKQESSEALTPLPKTSRTRDLHASEIGLRHETASGISVFARTGRSYRIANVDENRCFFPPCPSLLEPQTSRDSEIGAEWRQQDVQLRASLFESKLRNEIYYNNLTFTNTNLSPTRRRGIELFGGFKPGAAWEVDARYFYTDARFDQGAYGGVDVSGKEVPLVPRHRATFNLGWQAGVDTRLSASAAYIGRQRYDNDPANRFHEMPSYMLVDVKLARQCGPLKLAGGINNLFDKRYYSYALVNSSFAPTTFSAYPGTPRTAYVSGEYAW